MTVENVRRRNVELGLNIKTYHATPLVHMPARRQVISRVTQASACHHTVHANHWHRLWEIPPIIAVKSNAKIVNLVFRFVVSMFHCFIVVLQDLNTPIDYRCDVARHEHSFPWRRVLWGDNFPWRNNGRSAWNGSGFEHYFRLLRGEYHDPRGEMKNVMLW